MAGSKLARSLALALAASLAARPAGAQATALRFDARLVPSTAVLAGTLAAGLAPVVFASSLPHATCAPCDPSGLSWLDRGTVGPVRPGVSSVSDATLLLTGAGAGLLLAADARHDAGMVREDLTVFAQSLATASMLAGWAKVVFHRPRPYRYTAAAAGSGAGAESGLSFPSGHATFTFAAAFAYWSIEARRGRAGARTPGIVALLAAAATTSTLRVVARKHFPTDVLAGAVLGGTVGWVVPRIYPARRVPAP
jgi:membrane-associated phospholipid phosphatase